jgi:hypothetical protein
LPRRSVSALPACAERRNGQGGMPMPSCEKRAAGCRADAAAGS